MLISLRRASARWCSSPSNLLNTVHWSLPSQTPWLWLRLCSVVLGFSCSLLYAGESRWWVGCVWHRVHKQKMSSSLAWTVGMCIRTQHNRRMAFGPRLRLEPLLYHASQPQVAHCPLNVCQTYEWEKRPTASWSTMQQYRLEFTSSTFDFFCLRFE